MLPRYVPAPNDPSAFWLRASHASPCLIALSVSGVIISVGPSGTSPRRDSPNPSTDLLLRREPAVGHGLRRRARIRPPANTTTAANASPALRPPIDTWSHRRHSSRTSLPLPTDRKYRLISSAFESAAPP